MDTIQSLNEKILALQARMTAMEKPSRRSPKEPKDANAPKKEANWFISGMEPIRSALKPLAEAYNATQPAGTKKLTGTLAPQVARALKQLGQYSATASPTAAMISEAFKDWVSAYEAGTLVTDGPRLREEAASRRSGASSASGGSAAPKAEISEEMAAAKRSQKAAKAAATRAANKAKKAAEPEPEPKAEPKAEPEAEADAAGNVVLEEYTWTGDIGKGSKEYGRVDYLGKAYIYTAGGDYLGVWDAAKKVMDKTVPDVKED
jgi:hypothetical protein